MTASSWNKYLTLRESIKDEELNRILDKLSNGGVLTTTEKNFLITFDEILESDISTQSHLSKNQVVLKVKHLLDGKKKVLCEMCDRDGLIDDEIIGVRNDFERDVAILNLKHGETTKLFDRFFYRIEYNFQKDCYYLYQGEEFFEKIEVNNED